MKEKILETFKNLGFKLKEKEGLGYFFSYEGLNMLYMYNENDEDFLAISLPNIMDVKEENMVQVCALLEKVNSTLKYVKAYTLGDNIWLFYERELFGNDDLETIIPRMIFHLEAGLMFARKAMAEIEESLANKSSDDSETEECVAEQIVDDNNDNDE